MSSLDLLDYQTGLDEALAQPGPDGRPLLPAALRRQAVKDARRVVDNMAFRFAIMEERPLPEDLDYLRALEAVKAPPDAARVLARRRPHYARVRRRRLATTWGILAILAILVGGLAWVATSEEAQVLATVSFGTRSAVYTQNATFDVDPNFTRLHLDGTLILARGTPGTVEVRLLDPDGVQRFQETHTAQDTVYLRGNVAARPGTWTLLVDFNGAEGSARVDVMGVRPAR